VDNIKYIFSKFTDIDFVINVAGTNLCEPIENIDVAEWERVMNVNLKSFFVICKEAVNLMKKQNYGRIVNVSSIAGRNKSIVSGVHYTSSKYGIIGLTKQLANEVSKHNILVNCVCPSQTMTEMLEESMSDKAIAELEAKIPVRRIATTIEQALPILFLCSSAASYISGAAIDVNGGQL
jgi:3-oxoacyl-[acyl-carrier protein] reductase